MEKNPNESGNKIPAKENKQNDLIAPDETTSAGNEKDADELVHSHIESDISDIGEQDPDDAIHKLNKATPQPGNELDVDDLIHKSNDIVEKDI